MKKHLLVSVLFLILSSLNTQSNAQENKSYALLDLGFNAKMLNLASTNPQMIVKKEAEVKKSPRSLNDILNKKKHEVAVPKELTYHLVAGCFSSSKNAKEYVVKLTKDGYDASLIGKSKDLYLVSFSSFNSYTEAFKEFSKLESKGVDTWIKKN
jgi:hypothetical protein